MYGIRWSCYEGNSEGDNLLIGSWTTVNNLAHVFENAKINYTICRVGYCPYEKPNDSYKHWVTWLFPDAKEKAEKMEQW